MNLKTPSIVNKVGTESNVSGRSNTETPWDKSDKDEVFWSPLEIKGDRWDKLYPYRLLVIDIKNAGAIYGSSVSQGKTTKITNEGGIVNITQQVHMSKSWEFRLPISPQQLQITDNYAINTTATMRGIIEEHNGVKFKTIIASGTTGVWPRRPVTGGFPKAKNAVQSIFSGTIESFNGAAASAQSVARAYTGKHPQPITKAIDPKDTVGGLEGTGYYQALMLGQFIERYVQEKKKHTNKDLRLVFDIPKQNKSFIVTPVNFSLKQSEQKPSEHLWSFNLKAWKRIELKEPSIAVTQLQKPLTANNFQTMINTLSAARNLMSRNVNLIKAVRSDFQSAFNILRQTSLLVKDLAGFAFTLADLAPNIISDLNATVKESILNLKSTFKRGSTAGGSTSSLPIPGVVKTPTIPSFETASIGDIVNFLVEEDAINEGVPAGSGTGGTAAPAAAPAAAAGAGAGAGGTAAAGAGAAASAAGGGNETDPFQQILNEPEANIELMTSIPVNSLKLTAPQKEAISKELELVGLIRIDQIREFKANILDLSLSISNNYGAGSEAYAEMYGLDAPKSRVIPMSIEENEILIALMDTIQVFDLLSSVTSLDDVKTVSSLEFVGGLANESDISIDQVQNKLLVPVPFGSTIEEISARYLGDSNKFIEIATINNLRSPYIDEDGFIYDLLSNGDGRQINVVNSDDNLYTGQKINLKSDIVPLFTRKIISVDKIGDGNYLVTIDGLDDLGKLKTADNAKIQGYLPGTVNSQNQIYIPTNQQADPDDGVKTISHLDEKQLTKLSKVDFLLTEAGDIALNSVGDFRLANGLTNLVQSLKLKIQTKQGSLLRHLDYGLGLQHGVSVADLNSGAIIDTLNQMITDDVRFSAIERIDLEINGSTLNISLAVTIANQTGVVPITFNVDL